MQSIDKELYSTSIRFFSARFSAGIVCLIAFIVFSAGSVSAQGSDLEKKVYKTPTTTKKVVKKKAAPKPVAKKATPKKATTKKTSSSKSSKPKRTRTRRTVKPKTVKLKFNTPKPDQEIWLGEEKLGVSNKKAVLEKEVRIGNYIVTVRDSVGNVVGQPQMVEVTKDLKSADLNRPVKPDSKLDVDPAEEALKSNISESFEESEKILGILKSYGDPMKSQAVSISDWEYVQATTASNQINGFTAVQIEAQRWFAAGQIELANGKHADALTAFKESKGYMTNSAFPDYAIGETYLANGQKTPALTHYNQSILIDPNFALSHAKIGDIYRSMGKSKESSEAYKKAVEYGFKSSAIRYSLAQELMKEKQWDEASVQLESVAKESPTGDVFLLLGNLYGEQKRNISSYEAFRKATELMPNSAIAFFRLGVVLTEEREFGRSLEAFERAVELDPRGADIDVGTARKHMRAAEKNLR